jgi:flavin-binding protein dodecin
MAGSASMNRSSNHVEHPGEPMSTHTYRVTEIVGTSQDGVDDAIRSGLQRASATVRNLDWFEVTQIRGHLEDGQVEHYQVGMKVGFRIDE